MQSEFEAALTRLDETNRSDTRIQGPSDDLFKAWTFLYLWLACLWVVVEGYRDSYQHGPPVLSDTRVDQLLQNSFADKLKRFRNKVFHPEPFDHEAVRAVLKEHEKVRAWAGELTHELARCLHSAIAKP